jgi:histidinol-phosphate aminotransferase
MTLTNGETMANRSNDTRADAAVTPAAPAAGWLSSYLTPSILDAPGYKIDTPAVRIKLDQNESPWDWPAPIKQKIAEKLVSRPWNRYPPAFADDLADKVAQYAGAAPGTVLLGPGSNYLVSLVLSVFSKSFQRRGAVQADAAKLVIARPSFPLYESHCRYEGIPYEPWLLNADLEYDAALLPKLVPGSMVVFASPNNPVGNALPKAELTRLLAAHPEVLFVADEAYCEYTTERYTDLLAKHANLMLIRTFSKTLGCAGVRVGYVLAHPQYLAPLRKLRLPYLLNQFALAATEVILEDRATQDYLKQVQTTAVTERQRVYTALAAGAARGKYHVKPSTANFLLVRWESDAAATSAYQQLITAGILVRNVMAGPGLSGCLRVTMGTEQENDALVRAFGDLRVG